MGRLGLLCRNTRKLLYLMRLERSMTRREFITLLGSTAAMWPGLAHAQRPARIPKVGVLWHAANIEEETPYYQSLVEGFRKLGYVDGQNITLEHRFPNEVPEIFAKMAAELVSLNCDVLVGAGAAGPHLKKATKTIPIVFMFIPDPIGADLVEGIARPGGNVTGLSNFSVQLSAKRLQYLKEIVPTVTRVGLLINPNVKYRACMLRRQQRPGTSSASLPKVSRCARSAISSPHLTRW
jgi:putative tryptophan/tyrosine transport system substrate-binding protein